jgi:hypothetical protein
MLELELGAAFFGIKAASHCGDWFIVAEDVVVPVMG